MNAFVDEREYVVLLTLYVFFLIFVVVNSQRDFELLFVVELHIRKVSCNKTVKVSAHLKSFLESPVLSLASNMILEKRE